MSSSHTRDHKSSNGKTKAELVQELKDLQDKIAFLTNELRCKDEDLEVQKQEMEAQNEELKVNNEELVKATRSLAESEARFRSVLDNSIDVIYSLDAQTGRFEYISPSAETVVGFSPEELKAQDAETALAMIHPDDISAMRAAMARLEATGKGNVEYRQRTKSGDYRWISNHMSLTRDSAGRPLYRNGNIRDITKRKRAEERVAYQANLLENITDVVYSTDDQLRITSWNHAAEKVYGWKEAEALGRNVVEVTGSTFNPKVRARLTHDLIEQGLITTEIEHTTRSGKHIIFESNTMLLQDTRGNITGFIGVNHDITDRKRAEAALQESEERYRTIVETANSIILRWDVNSRITFLNEYAQKFFGYTRDEIIGKDIMVLLPAIESTGRDISVMDEDIKRFPDRYVDNVNENVRKNGERVWVWWTNKALYDKQGNLVEVLAIGNDITERKKAEDALCESEEKYRTIVETANEGIVMAAPSGTIIFANARMADMLGYTSEELVGMDGAALIDQEELEKSLKRIEKRKSGIKEGYDLKFIRKDCSELWTYANGTPVYDHQGIHIGNMAMYTDISERKLAEDALRESEEHFRKLFMSINEGFYTARILYDDRGMPYDYMYTEVNPAFEQMMDLSRDQIIGKRYTELVTNRSSRWMEIFKEVALTGKPANYGFYSHAFHRHFETLAYRPTDGQFAVLVSDISDRKKAEEALRESEEKYRTIVELANEGVWAIDAEARTTFVNERMAEMLGYKPEEMVGKESFDFMDEETKTASRLRLEQRSKGVKDNPEVKYIRKDGSSLWTISSSTPLYDKAGRFIGVIGMVTDITEHKRAEDASRESEVRLSAILEQLPVGVVVFDRNGQSIIKNSVMAGYMSGDIPSHDMQEMVRWRAVDPEGHPIPPDQWPGTRALRGDTVSPGMELFYTDQAGREHWTIVSAVPFRSPEGAIIGGISVTTDITERKQAEEALRTNLQRVHTILSGLSAAILLVTKEQQVEFANQEFCDYFHLKNTPAELTGLGASEMIAKIKDSYINPDEAVERIREIVRCGEPVRGEEVAMKGRTCLRNFIPIYVDGKLHGRLWLHLDITEHKRVEEALRESELHLSQAQKKLIEKINIDLDRRTTELRTLLDLLPISACITEDQDSKTMYSNPTFEELLGIQRNSNMSMSAPDDEKPGFKSFLNGVELSPDELPMQRAIETGAIVLNADFDIVRSDGRIVNFHGHAAPLYDEEGNVRGAIGAFEDFTQYKSMTDELLRAKNELELHVIERTKELTKANIALQRSESNMIRAQQVARIGNWELDLARHEFTGSRAFYNILDLTTDERSFGDLLRKVSPDERQRLMDSINAAIYQNKLLDVEFSIITADGEKILHILGDVEYAMDGSPIKMSGVTKDVTELRQYADKLLQINKDLDRRVNELQVLFDVLPISICISEDPECKTMYANKVFEKLVGVSDGSNISQSAPMDEKPSFKAFHNGREIPTEELPMQKAAATGKPVYGSSFDAVCADGRVINFYGHAAPLFDEEGRSRGAIGVFDDMTERTRNEKALAEAKMQAELYLDLMGHDISNMHQIAMGQLELANEIMDEEGGLKAEERELIETPLDTLSRSARLIDNVRNLQKMKAGEFKEESIDLNDLLVGIVKEYEFMVPVGSIKFFGQGPHNVIANKLLHDVFSNLVGNAIKHSNGNGIDINIKLEGAGDNGRNCFKVSVEDNGPGIPDEFKDKIFNRLQRGQTKARGLGLGLYLVKSLVESYHGRVLVENRVPGDHRKGSRFIVYLPVAEGEHGKQ